MTNKWVTLRMTPDDGIARLQDMGGISEVTARFLWQRGIRTPSAYHALMADDEALSSPLDLPAMAEAVELLHRARQLRWPVRVYGDYDADGVTATAIMLQGLEQFGIPTVDYHIPNRFDEGYGLNVDAVEKAAMEGIKLLITVDCGSSSPQAAEVARQLGIILVITDHHGLGTQVPRAEALVNPELMPIPNRFSGAGVALQVIRALHPGVEVPEALFGIAAVGTVADVVPLIGDNRRLVKRGLRALREGHVPGVLALLNTKNRPSQWIMADDLGFIVGPRLNAAGRMGDATPAVQLLMERDTNRATLTADLLHTINEKRQSVEKTITQEAWAQLIDREGPVSSFVVVAGEGWHEGVVGIVASRLKDALRRPVAVIRWNDEDGKGSARSMGDLHLLEHLRKSHAWFSKLGGHRGAAGFSLPRIDPVALSAQLSKDLPLSFKPSQFTGYEVDAIVAASRMGTEAVGELMQFEPFGHGFERPRLWIHGEIDEHRAVGSDKSHLQLRFRDNPINSIAFGKGRLSQTLDLGGYVTAISRPVWNVFNQKRRAQWMIDDILGISPTQTVVPQESPFQIENLSGQIIWVVDSTLEQVAWSKKRPFSACYHAHYSLGDLVMLEKKFEAGIISELVVSQWRLWPQLVGVAHNVVWLCTPRDNLAMWESGAFLQEDGMLWLAGHPTPMQEKLHRIMPSRQRLGRHWKRWQQDGKHPMIIGKNIFEELALIPNQLSGKRPLTDSPTYNWVNYRQNYGKK